MKKLTRKFLSILLVVIILLSPSFVFASEQYPEDYLSISPWAIRNLHDGQMMGLLDITNENLTKDYTDVVSSGDIFILNENLRTKLDGLLIEKNKNFIPVDVPDNSTRLAVVLSLYNILGVYDKSINEFTEPIDYLVENNILLGKGSEYNLDDLATMEEAITFYVRGVTNTYYDNDLGGKGIFYKIQNNGNTVYLFGSIHVGDFSMYPLEKTRMAAFNESDVLMVELNLLDPKTIDEVNKYQFRNDGTKLVDDLGPELYKKVKTIMNEYQVPEKILENMETWALLNTLITLPIQLDNPQTSALGIDNYFLTQAALNDMEIIPLETVEMQMNILKDYYSKRNENLVDAIKIALEELKSEDSKNKIVREIKELQKIWSEGREKDLAKSFSEEASSQVLVSTRDPLMAENIKNLLEKNTNKTYFVVVGAGHYAPENSILYYLEKSGFEVENLND